MSLKFLGVVTKCFEYLRQIAGHIKFSLFWIGGNQFKIHRNIFNCFLPGVKCYVNNIKNIIIEHLFYLVHCQKGFCS